jgi:hypothetical protein
MKHQSKSKSAKKPQTRDELFDAMIPQRSVEKTAEILEKHKAKHDPRTRAVNSAKFGFKGKPLTIFVRPDATDEQIIEKFRLRLGSREINNYSIRKNTKVPKAAN